MNPDAGASGLQAFTAAAAGEAVQPATGGARESGAARGPGLVRLTAWFALVTGLLDAGILLGQHLRMGWITGVSPDAIWLAPIGYALLFAPAIGLVALATARLPEATAFSWRVGVLALLSWGSLLLFLYLRLHPAALAPLALGLAFQTAHLASAHRAGFARLVRRTVAPMTVLIVLLALALPSVRRIREARALAALPGIPAGALNVLLVILDTVRAESLGLYGGGWDNTPRLEALAAQGVMFEDALTLAPWTLASHASMFTGQPPHELSTGWERALDDRWPTLAEVLRDRGYLTAGFTGNFYYTTWESGLQRGFVHYDAQPVTVRQAFKSTALVQWLEHELLGRSMEERTSDRRSAGDINAAFLDWLARSRDRPFFAFLNYIDAHLPYEPPEPFRTRFHADSSKLNAYTAAIAYQDGQVGALLDSLARRGLRERTLVIVTSDHGELLGEHGLSGHTRGLFMPLLHVPLLIAGPGVPAGMRASQVVKLSDLAATVLDVLGPAGAAALPGRSLAAWRRPAGSQARSDTVLSEYGPGGAKSLFDGRWHYIREPVGKELLFDVGRDPGELRDFSGRTPVALLGSFRARLRPLPARAERGGAVKGGG